MKILKLIFNHNSELKAQAEVIKNVIISETFSKYHLNLLNNIILFLSISSILINNR